MTRRLLGGFIEGLPAWLDKQVAVPVPSQTEVTVPQKDFSNARSSVANDATQSSTLAGSVETHIYFLIETISLSPLNPQCDKPSIRLGFLSQGGQNKMGITLTFDEFTAVITALVERAEGWGLAHPWPKNAASPMTQYSGRLVH